LSVLRHELQTQVAVPAAPQAPAPARRSRATAADTPVPPPLPEIRLADPPAAPVSTKAAPVPSGVSGGQYWVRLRGRVSGPFDLPALQRQLKQGQISRMHQVSSDQVTWKQASEIEGLYGPTTV
jgi:hypothetical protein